MNTRTPWLLSALLIIATSTGAQEEEQTATVLDGIVAVVNEGVVLKSQLDQEQNQIIQRATTQGMQLPPAHILREQVLERLIVEEIQMQRANRIGIQISDQMLNGAIAQIAQSLNIPFEQMPALVAQDGLDWATYRRDMRKQLIQEQLRQIDVVNRISVSPREIQSCVTDLEDNSVVNSRYNLSHILVSIPAAATNEEIAEAQQQANEIYQLAQNGESFAELAIRYSDSDTALEGGSLGWREGDQLPTLFFDVVGGMQSGDVSEPIRATSGFHLVRINELQGVNQKSEIQQVKVRHILITPDEIIDDETAKQQLEDASVRIKAGESFSEIAKLLSDDPGSKNTGGEMNWTGPGEFVPEFEEVTNALEAGVLSEPFRSRFGWHIVEVLDRRTYDNTEDLKRNNCVQRVRNGKLSNETELWIRRIRDEAFVDVRI